MNKRDERPAAWRDFRDGYKYALRAASDELPLWALQNADYARGFEAGRRYVSGFVGSELL